MLCKQKNRWNLQLTKKVAIVTGSSTGIEYETSLASARDEFITYATMRNVNKAKNIKSVSTKENLPLHVKQPDVTDDVSVKNAVQAISSETGRRIDVLVDNAGYGLNGVFEDLAMGEIKAQYETNVFGLIPLYDSKTDPYPGLFSSRNRRSLRSIGSIHEELKDWCMAGKLTYFG